MNQLPCHFMIALAAMALPLWLSCAPKAPDTSPPPGTTEPGGGNTTASELSGLTTLISNFMTQARDARNMEDVQCIPRAAKDSMLQEWGAADIPAALEKCQEAQKDSKLVELLKENLENHCNSDLGYKQQKGIDLSILAASALATAVTTGDYSNFATNFNSAMKTSLESENTAINNYNSQVSTTASDVLTCKSSGVRETTNATFEAWKIGKDFCLSIVKNIINKATCADNAANGGTQNDDSNSDKENSDRRGSEGLE